MHPSLAVLFKEIEEQREHILDSIAHLTREELNYSPANGKWSVAQILSHIITSERMSLLYIKKKFLGVDSISDSGLLEELKMGILIISQRIPALKFKAPKLVVQSTMVYDDLEQIRTEWQTVRKELASTLDSIPEKYINRKIYRHILAGYLNVKHALIFLREHFLHHLPQIKRLVKEK